MNIATALTVLGIFGSAAAQEAEDVRMMRLAEGAEVVIAWILSLDR